jgi:hypothetical protein
MQVFRSLLKTKLNDPDFNELYRQQCAVCPVTVALVTALAEASYSQEEIAERCGISVQAISDLKTADYCDVGAVKKLCNYFGIPWTRNCLKSGGDK